MALLSLPQVVVPPSVASAAPPPAVVTAKINFQPTATIAPAGFTKDIGAAYTDAAGFGWVREDSLAGTHVPLALTLNTRDRSACTALSVQQRTFIHMQAPVTNATNDATKGAWEYAVPNGKYQVSVGIGDANLGADAESHTLNVEGVNAVLNFPRSSVANCGATRLRATTVWTTVTDGKLTVDAVGGTNTKLQYVTIDSVPVDGLTATPAGTAVELDWTDLDGATGYRIWRSSTLPVVTTGTPLGTPTTSAYTDATAVKGTVYHYAVAAAGTGAPASSAVVSGMIDDPSPASPTLPLKINFQDLAGIPPTGYTKDYGQNYANVRGFGWVIAGTSVPVDITSNGRTRTDGTQDPLNSTMHMQGNTVANFNGNPVQAAWQLAVPAGSYDVEIGVGDALPGNDPTSHEINVEGQKVIDDFAVTSTTAGTARFKEVVKTGVQVSDGFLTVDPLGGTNTKIDYIRVAATSSDTPPAAPTGLVAVPGDASVALNWADNGEPDLKGYNVFRGTTAAVATTAGSQLNGATPLTASEYTDATAANLSTYYYAVVAVDNANQSSPASAVVSATPDAAAPTPFAAPFKVNFLDAATPDTAGFTKDFGQAYTNTRSYGWVNPTTGAPLNLVGNGRLRAVRPGVTVDIRQRGLMHMQADDVTPPFNGVAAEGTWEIAVANGAYAVTVSVGDQPGANNIYDSKHSVNVEGVPAITQFQATAADEFETATVTATVSDGKLTLDAAGGTNTKINYVDVVAADVAAPAAPAGLTATAGEGQNSLSWTANAEPDLAGYHVYASTEATVALTPENRLTPATPQTGTTFTHTGLTNGTAYHYVVVAVDQAGNASPASTTATATPADTTAPGAPTALQATAGDSKIDLAWTAPPAADVKEYRVFRAEGGTVEATGTPLATVTHPTATYSDTTAPNGTQYTYAVVAVDQSGNLSPASNPSSATAADTVAPGAPTNVNASPGDAKVTLTWSGPAQTDDVQSYRIYRAESPITDIQPLAPTHTVNAADGTTLEDTGLTNGTTYYYRVTAVDEANNGSEASEERSATPVPDPDTTAPAVPTGLTATPSDNSVALSWTAVADPDADLRGYNVFRSASAGGERTLLTTGAPVTAAGFVDNTAVNGNAYFYVVRSVDTTGNASAESAEASATPKDLTPPDAVTGVTATAGIEQVTVTWSAAPTGSDVTAFKIYRSTTAAAYPGDFGQIGQVDVAAARTFTDNAAVAGTTYYYAVTAIDEATPPNESGAPLNPNATPLPAPDTTPPAAPTALAATVTGDDVALSWTASTSTDTAGYAVYRSAVAGGPGVKINAAAVTGTTFTDADRPASSVSYYTVVAVDGSNNESARSNEVSATVAAPAINLAYSFQPDSAATVAGFTKDTGAAYSAATGRGWITQASLATQTRTPLDLTANTRVRTRAVTDEQNRLIHLQYGDIVPTPTTNGSLTPGAWEHVLPNGRYTVTASVGDQPGAAKTGCPAPCYDSVHMIRAEGVTVVPAFQATAAAEYKSATATVDVTDGKLTVDAVGGTNTKLNSIRIVSAGPVAPDTTPPAAPSGLTGIAGNASASLSWAAPADSDVAGYNLYRAAGSTVTPSAATKVSASLIIGTGTTDTGLTNGTQYAYVVTAVDTAGNEGQASAVSTVTPTPTTPALSVKVDFATQATTPASGYLLDYGQSFGARTGANQGTGNSYGWVTPGTSTPVSIAGNGRNRNTDSPSANEPDARQATFIHMQYTGTVAGSVALPGAWEMAVPNGLYTVTVSVGDAGTAVDSSHWVNIENQNAIAAFVPSTGVKYATATRTVAVIDGRITLSPTGGTNTKITYVDIASFNQDNRPYAAQIVPANGTIDTVTNISPTTNNVLPNGAVNPTTVAGGVKLTRVSDGFAVPGVGATSGGGDTVSFRATDVLDPNTLYRFDITASVTDAGGRPFVPFSSVFTTRSDSTNPGTINAAFDKVDAGASKGGAYTSLTFGPDGRLYAGSIFGQIYRWTVNADGTLANETVINTVRAHASAAGWDGAPNRTVIGMAFDPASTPTNPILWITDNYAYLGADVPDGTGAVSRLSGPNLENYQEVVINLPRSIKDHETNSLAFKNDKLYFTQGSMNAMGAYDGTWRRDEHLLSAAVLELDPAKLPATLPLDASTPDLAKAPTSNRVHGRTYNPYAPDAPLTIYASGVRNAYDLVWHSNGNLYVGTNGSAAGGNTPAVPATLPASCANRPDGGYTGPSAPALTNNRQDETDYMFNVKKGKYYGHPNLLRCEYILNAGNPVGYTGNPLFKVNAYPSGQAADPNYDLANVYDAGLHASANGTIEYKNTAAFNGALTGKLVVVRYSANQELVTFDVRANGSLSTATTGITGFTGFAQPLDVTEDVATGNLYVAELPNDFSKTAIKLLKPQGAGAVGRGEATGRLVFTEVAGGAASAAQNVAVKNIGGAPLTITGATITGADGSLFAQTATLPVTIAAGATANLPITFNPATGVTGPKGATLVVNTDSTATPALTVNLRGLGTLGTGGSNEPSLQWILDTLQIPVNVGDPNPANNDLPASSALIGDEVKIESFRKAPFDFPVRIEPISLFGPAGNNGSTDVVTVGIHTTGNVADRTVVGVGPNTQNQKVLPAFTGVAEYDLPENFGFDFTWHGLSNRVANSEDALNTWDAANPHKVRVYPLKNADGSVEPYAYIVAPEDVLTPVDFQDAAIIVRNVVPVATTGAGEITSDKPELVFSGMKTVTSPAQVVTVTNAGTTPLVITGVAVTGPNAAAFSLTGGGPTTLAPGQSGNYSVVFAPNGTVGTLSAALRFTSDDASTPTFDVGLYGLSTNGEQGNNEPRARPGRQDPGPRHQRRRHGPDHRHRTGSDRRRGQGTAVHQGRHRPGDDEARRPLLARRAVAVRLVPADRRHPGDQPGRRDRARPGADAQPGDRRRRGVGLRPRRRHLRVLRGLELVQPQELHAGRPEHRHPARGAHLSGEEPGRRADPEHLPGDLRGRVQRRLPGLRVRGGQREGRRRHRRHHPGRQDRRRAGHLHPGRGLHPRQRRGVRRRRLRLGQAGHRDAAEHDGVHPGSRRQQPEPEHPHPDAADRGAEPGRPGRVEVHAAERHLHRHRGRRRPRLHGLGAPHPGGGPDGGGGLRAHHRHRIDHGHGDGDGHRRRARRGRHRRHQHQAAVRRHRPTQHGCRHHRTDGQRRGQRPAAVRRRVQEPGDRHGHRDRRRLRRGHHVDQRRQRPVRRLHRAGRREHGGRAHGAGPRPGRRRQHRHHHGAVVQRGDRRPEQGQHRPVQPGRRAVRGPPGDEPDPGPRLGSAARQRGARRGHPADQQQRHRGAERRRAAHHRTVPARRRPGPAGARPGRRPARRGGAVHRHQQRDRQRSLDRRIDRGVGRRRPAEPAGAVGRLLAEPVRGRPGAGRGGDRPAVRVHHGHHLARPAAEQAGAGAGERRGGPQPVLAARQHLCAGDRAAAGGLPHPGQHGHVLLAHEGLQHHAVGADAQGRGRAVHPAAEERHRRHPGPEHLHAHRRLRHQDRSGVERPDQERPAGRHRQRLHGPVRAPRPVLAGP